MNENLSLSRETQQIIKGLVPQPTEISFALIDLSQDMPQIAGFNLDTFLYPASVWKVFIAAEILRKADAGILDLVAEVDIASQDKDGKDIQFFPSGSKTDHRPVLQIGDKLTIGYLVDLMLTRSDNVASNALMSIAGREDINDRIILANGWNGSEVPNEHVACLKAQPTYQFSKVTVSTARHFAELFYKIETGELVNGAVSKNLKRYMQNSNHGSRADLYIPEFESYYRKGGWLEIDERQNGDTTENAVIRWVNDAGVVRGQNSHYVISMLTRTNSKEPTIKFPVEDFSRKVYQLMESRLE
jgi:hypothetical protein